LAIGYYLIRRARIVPHALHVPVLKVMFATRNTVVVVVRLNLTVGAGILQEFVPGLGRSKFASWSDVPSAPLVELTPISCLLVVNPVDGRTTTPYTSQSPAGRLTDVTLDDAPFVNEIALPLARVAVA
jgi:hypothetical protein